MIKSKTQSKKDYLEMMSNYLDKIEEAQDYEDEFSKPGSRH
jgi:hypothetical protein